MNGTFAALGVLCLVGLGFYLLNRKIDRRLETSALVQKIQQEVDEILIELNSTTERNIGLIEERIRSLSGVLEQADRKIGVMKREVEKQNRSADVYTNVQAEAMKRRQESLRATEKSAPAEAADSAPKLRDRVKALRNQGHDSQQIAAKLGSTVGEVELILSLFDRADDGRNR